MASSFGMLSALPSELFTAILKETQDWKLVVKLEAITAQLLHLYLDAGQALNALSVMDVFPASSYLVRIDHENLEPNFMADPEVNLTLLEVALHVRTISDPTHIRRLLLQNLSSIKIISYLHSLPSSPLIFAPLRKRDRIIARIVNRLPFRSGNEEAALFHIMDHAASMGFLDAVRFLNERRGEGCTIFAMDAAAYHDQLEVLEYLHANRSEGCSGVALEFLVERFVGMELVGAFAWAVCGDHVDVLKVLHATGRVDDGKLGTDGEGLDIIDYAAERGNLKALEFLDCNGYGGATSYGMDMAAAGGYLEVVRYLSERRREGCTTDAMDLAAKAGFVDVVRFLHEMREEGCTTDAMDRAAMYGHLEVVKFLNEFRKEGCTTRAMDLAAKYGHVEVVRYLHANRKEGCTKRALNWAIVWGHLEIVEFLCRERSEGCNPDAIENCGVDPDERERFHRARERLVERGMVDDEPGDYEGD
ncbi:hypothetical protein HDU97_002955 [Phlyctochytrium planicorne]|nr:hypothetical protein HDU97_002955 [Phlyctochytrium planicorne]